MARIAMNARIPRTIRERLDFRNPRFTCCFSLILARWFLICGSVGNLRRESEYLGVVIWFFCRRWSPTMEVRYRLETDRKIWDLKIEQSLPLISTFPHWAPSFLCLRCLSERLHLQDVTHQGPYWQKGTSDSAGKVAFYQP